MRFGVIVACVMAAAQALAQPMPTPLPTDIPAPRDEPYPGVIKLAVDATDIARHIFQVRETIPVQGGSHAVLLYPKWLPGHHSPVGRIEAPRMRMSEVLPAPDGPMIAMRSPRVADSVTPASARCPFG